MKTTRNFLGFYCENAKKYRCFTMSNINCKFQIYFPPFCSFYHLCQELSSSNVKLAFGNFDTIKNY